MTWPRVDGLRTFELGAPGEQRVRLTGYVLRGRKRATTGVAEEYVEEGESIEHVGEVLVLLGNDREPLGRIRITDVVVQPFGEVPWEFADAEGEGFTSLQGWRDGHTSHWDSEGRTVTPETEVVCLRFDLLDDRGDVVAPPPA